MTSAAVRVNFQGKTFVGHGFRGPNAKDNALILILHDAMGCKKIDVYRAQTLAKLFGCSAMALDIYGEEASPPASRETEEALHRGFELMNALLADPVYLRGLLRAFLDAGVSQLRASPSRVAALGFCFGGGCVVDMVRSNFPLAAAVSFHGVLDSKPMVNLLGHPAPPFKTPLPVPQYTEGVHMLVCTGRADPLVPPQMVEDFQNEMNRAPAIGSLQVHTYSPNVIHAFTTPNRGESNGIVGFNANAARFAWTSAFQLFAHTLNLPLVNPPREFFQDVQTSFL